MAKLTDGLGESGGGSIDLRAWCAEQNAKPLFRRMARWFYVAQSEGREVIHTLDGTDADCLRKMLAGKLDDFYGWNEHRMAGYRRWLWRCAEAGSVEPLRIGEPA